MFVNKTIKSQFFMKEMNEIFVPPFIKRLRKSTFFSLTTYFYQASFGYNFRQDFFLCKEFVKKNLLNKL